MQPMAKYNHVVISTRFITTIGHILAIAMVKSGLQDNIRSSLDPQMIMYHHEEPYPFPYPTPDSSYYLQYQSLYSSATSAINMAYVCLALDLFGLIFGSSLFLHQVNIVQALLHFVGSVLTCWFIGKRADDIK